MPRRFRQLGTLRCLIMRDLERSTNFLLDRLVLLASPRTLQLQLQHFFSTLLRWGYDHALKSLFNDEQN
jgi:hypothetical protein